MAKISDEIRKWCDDVDCDGGKIRTTKELRVLAGFIDAKTVELPRSADGRIWTGREECFWTGPANEDWHEFCGLHYSDGRWCVEDVDFERYPAASVWYERPDGLERIADELEGLSVDSMISDTNLLSSCALDLAKRIRKLAAKEEQK